jgi:hypothetical protein
MSGKTSILGACGVVCLLLSAGVVLVALQIVDESRYDGQLAPAIVIMMCGASLLAGIGIALPLLAHQVARKKVSVKTIIEYVILSTLAVVAVLVLAALIIRLLGHVGGGQPFRWIVW